jgi:hypothetical protein
MYLDLVATCCACDVSVGLELVVVICSLCCYSLSVMITQQDLSACFRCDLRCDWPTQLPPWSKAISDWCPCVKYQIGSRSLSRSTSARRSLHYSCEVDGRTGVIAGTVLWRLAMTRYLDCELCLEVAWLRPWRRPRRSLCAHVWRCVAI